MAEYDIVGYANPYGFERLNISLCVFIVFLFVQISHVFRHDQSYYRGNAPTLS